VPSCAAPKEGLSERAMRKSRGQMMVLVVCLPLVIAMVVGIDEYLSSGRVNLFVVVDVEDKVGKHVQLCC